MPRITKAHIDTSPVVAFPALTGVTSDGVGETRAVVTAANQPLHLWLHELPVGSAIRFAKPVVPHTLFVLKGAIEVNGERAPTEGAVIVEHNADAVIRATVGGTRLLQFHRPETHPERTARAGGHVHVGGPEGILKGDPNAARPVRVWANSRCPTCEIWLHRARTVPPNKAEAAHSHSADEIIFVLAGSVFVGRHEWTAGAALAIDANTAYKVVSGANGAQFINYRPTDNFYVRRNVRDGSTPKPVLNSELLMRLLQNTPA